MTSDPTASTWTPEAREYLDGYLAQVRALSRQSGEDAEEIASNLREHIEHETTTNAGALVTLDHLRAVLATVGTPEQVASADSLLARSTNPVPPTGSALTRADVSYRMLAATPLQLRTMRRLAMAGLILTLVLIVASVLMVSFHRQGTAKADGASDEQAANAQLKNIRALEEQGLNKPALDKDGDKVPDYLTLDELVEHKLLAKNYNDIAHGNFVFNLKLAPSASYGGKPGFLYEMKPVKDGIANAYTIDETGDIQKITFRDGKPLSGGAPNATNAIKSHLDALANAQRKYLTQPKKDKDGDGIADYANTFEELNAYEEFGNLGKGGSFNLTLTTRDSAANGGKPTFTCIANPRLDLTNVKPYIVDQTGQIRILPKRGIAGQRVRAVMNGYWDDLAHSVASLRTEKGAATMTSDPTTSTWTPEAREFLDGYLAQVRALSRQSGEDAEDIAANLREHIENETTASAGALVTLDHLRAVLAAVGTPEQVASTDSLLARPAASPRHTPIDTPNPTPASTAATTPQPASTSPAPASGRKVGCWFATALCILAAALLITLAVWVRVVQQSMFKGSIAAHEKGVVAILQKINSVEQEALTKPARDSDDDKVPDYLTLDELVKEGLLAEDYAITIHNNFLFNLKLASSAAYGGKPGFLCEAKPVMDDFKQSFSIDETGQVEKIDLLPRFSGATVVDNVSHTNAIKRYLEALDEAQSKYLTRAKKDRDGDGVADFAATFEELNVYEDYMDFRKAIGFNVSLSTQNSAANGGKPAYLCTAIPRLTLSNVKTYVVDQSGDIRILLKEEAPATATVETASPKSADFFGVRNSWLQPDVETNAERLAATIAEEQLHIVADALRNFRSEKNVDKDADGVADFATMEELQAAGLSMPETILFTLKLVTRDSKANGGVPGFTCTTTPIAPDAINGYAINQSRSEIFMFAIGSRQDLDGPKEPVLGPMSHTIELPNGR